MEKKLELIIYDKNIQYYDDDEEKVKTFDLTSFEEDEYIRIQVGIDDEKKIEEVLKDKELFKKDLLDQIEFRKNFRIDEEEKEDIILKELEFGYNYVLDRFDDLLNHVDVLRVNIDDLDIVDFVLKHKEFDKQKILADEFIDITDKERLKELENKYEKIRDRVRFSMEGNADYISFEDCYKTIDIIDKITDEIKKLNLSPMETAMYVYDLVRNRVYTSEDENESKLSSRDLTSVLLGDKIVCVGYTKIFNTIMKNLGFDGVVEVRIMEKGNEKSGHMRSAIYIKDSKYNIDGIYFFDPTWDSKYCEDDNEYVDSYKYFAKTYNYMEEDLENSFYEYREMSSLLTKEEMDDIFKSIIKGWNMEVIQYHWKLRFLFSFLPAEEFNKYYSMVSELHRYSDEEKRDFMEKIVEIYNHFVPEIPGEVMLDVLRNVRKIEYYQNPDLYPYDINNMYKSAVLSDWEFNYKKQEKDLTAEERLLRTIFGEKAYTPEEKRKCYLLEHQNEIKKEVDQVRLTRTLRNYLNSKAK